MKSVLLELPIRTISESNARGHWGQRHTRASAQRWSVGASLAARVVEARLVRTTKLRRELTTALDVLLVRIAPSNGLDDDNIRGALKAVRDGVADALGIDDRDPRVHWSYLQRRGTYGIEVHIVPRDMSGVLAV